MMWGRFLSQCFHLVVRYSLEQELSVMPQFRQLMRLCARRFRLVLTL